MEARDEHLFYEVRENDDQFRVYWLYFRVANIWGGCNTRVDRDVELALYGGNIKLTWLFDRYGQENPEKENMWAIILHTQVYLMLVIGYVIFPTKDKVYVHVRYIMFYLTSMRNLTMLGL